MNEILFINRSKVKRLIINKRKGEKFAKKLGIDFRIFKKYRRYIHADLKYRSPDKSIEIFTNYDEFKFYSKKYLEGSFKRKPIFKDVFGDKKSKSAAKRFQRHQLKRVKQYQDLPQSDKLDIKEDLFVNYYITLRNASEAAKRAGFLGNNAGSRQLKKSKVQKAIADRLAESFQASQVSPDEVIMDIKALRDRAMQAIPVTDSEGEFLGEWTYDPKTALKALELMGKYIKMFNEGVQVNITQNENKEYRYDFSALTDDELKEFRRLRKKIIYVEVLGKKDEKQ